jgi:hypothetical protein
MRLLVVPALAGAAWVYPMIVGGAIRRSGTPKQIVAFSLASIAAIGSGMVVGLGAIVDPAALPVRDLPALLGRCVDAAGRLLEHPLRHWPRILAAVVLVAVIVRLLWSGVATFREGRSRSRLVEAIGRQVPRALIGDADLVVVPADAPFAFTVGLRRRRIVVSTPVMNDLAVEERRAVLAHERAHANGWHPALLSVGTVLSRAFPFIRPLRDCAEHLIVGLEMAADEAAVRAVGDPLIVARTLLALAPHAPKGSSGIGVAGTSIRARVERLTTPGGPTALRTRPRVAWMVRAVALLALVLIVVLPASARALTGSGRTVAIHAACHLPHGD